MTDKQIIIYKKECYNEPHCSLNQVLEQLKRKEQECEELKDKLNCCFCNPYFELNDIEKQRKCIEVTECFRRQLDQLKAQLLDQEAETLKAGEIIHNLKQTLTKIKEICNNNDELKGDFNLVDCDKYKLGKHNLANKILQKISECEVEND